MPAVTKSKYLVNAGWDDIPHLDDQIKAELFESTPPFLRDARTKGVPSLGSGAIYPVVESDITIDPFPIPAYWPKAYGLDVGWNKTAVIWAAWDRDNDIVYLYTEHYRGQAEPAVHATAIIARGAWIPGVIDPSSRGKSQTDGDVLFNQYVDLNLDLEKAVNAVEAGIHAVWSRLSTGRLRIFSTCTSWLAEFRLYRRDSDGKVVKKFDHLMDATRYLAISGLQRAITKPADKTNRLNVVQHTGDSHAGY